uniref:Proteasome subunit beta n=3 Tax=Meloidogyne TaxID=189290 RepID=A0A915P8R9_9BILA
MIDSPLFSDMDLFKDSRLKTDAQQWNPYDDMGGTCAAIRGDDWVVFGSDTRMLMWKSILARDCEKIHVLDNNILLGTCGFYGDVLQLKKLLQLRQNQYKFNYQHQMTTEMFASMLSRILYSRRFFPFYTGCIAGGIDTKGKGALYSYDPVGHWRLAQTFCTGAGGTIVQSFFDITFQQETIDEGKRKPVTVEDAKKLMKDAFRSLAERETSTGDGLKIVWLKAGDKEAHSETCDLRGD